MSNTDIIILNHKWETEINSPEFDCNNDGVNKFLWFNIQDKHYYKARIHLLVKNDYQLNCGEDIIAYIAMRSTTVNVEENGVIKDFYPAIEIYQLGVNREYQKLGYGDKLISYGIVKAYEFNEYIASNYIVLNSTENAVSFYERYGFVVTSDSSRIILQDDTNENCIPMSLKL